MLISFLLSPISSLDVLGGIKELIVLTAGELNLIYMSLILVSFDLAISGSPKSFNRGLFNHDRSFGKEIYPTCVACVAFLIEASG